MVNDLSHDRNTPVDVDSTDEKLASLEGPNIPSPRQSRSAPLYDVKSNPYGARPACFKTNTQEVLFVLTTTMAVGQSSIFIGATIGINSHIAHDLNMTAAEVTWITAAQSLSAGCFLLLFGRAADLFGRRPMFLVSMGTFGISLLITGFASNALYMNIVCGIMGLCSAAAVPPAMGALGAVYPDPSRRKNRAFACFSAGNPLGLVLGLLVSGVATTISTWRASFWTLTIIYAIFSVAAWWTVPVDDPTTRHKFGKDTLAKFDFLGTFLVVTGTAMFTAALTLANDAPQGWRTSYVISLLVLGVTFIIAFVWWQHIFSCPLMPLTIWRDRNFTLLIASLCLGFYGFTNNIFWLSLFWQRVQNTSPLSVAVRLLPQAIGGIIVNIIAGLIMHRVSNKVLMAIGASAWLVSSVLLSTIPSENTSYWIFAFPALLLSVVGADLEFTVTNMYVMSSMPSSQQSVAGGLLNTLTRLSSSVGLGISTAVYTSVTKNSGEKDQDAFKAYRSTFYVALVGAGISLILLPLLTLKSQGGKKISARIGEV